VLIIACLAATSQPNATRYDVHHFTDCNAASLYAAAHPTVARYAYRVGAHLLRARIAPVRSGGYRAQAQIAFDLEDSQLRLPQWSWPGRSAAQRRAYDVFFVSLRAHELGHRAIAQSATQGHTLALTVVARSRAGAERALRAALAGQLHEFYAELLRKEELYDRVTEHGRRQSDGPLYGFPGGENVVFSCP
jgi:hypothetical protein